MKNPRNVYQVSMERIERIFADFDNIYVSFSGGKDSGVLLNLCISYIREHHLNRKLIVFHMDYEVQYAETTAYVNRVLASNSDILEVYRICVPFKVSTCTSMFQSYWRPWDEALQSLWVRERPKECYTQEDFPFYTPEMWDYEFQVKFSQWLHQKKGARRSCCLIGIRTQESLSRWGAIHNEKNKSYWGLKWTYPIGSGVCAAYPIYDWLTTDIWTANGKFAWDYNRLYDLYYQAGVSLDKQRVASPFISQALSSLKLYRVIDPNMWGRMIGRVNGVGFAGIYGGTSALGWYSIKLPAGMTWASYMEFLLKTLPEKTRKHYIKKLSVSIKFWREKGGCLSDETIEKLHKAGIPIGVEEKTNYKTHKRPVKMEYLDDINIAEFKELPTFKRICICILKNDHPCKYMGFTLNKEERERKKQIMDEFRSFL
ncbi:MAG: DUF3440 domain-containing protein [Bacteroidales bacterium]